MTTERRRKMSTRTPLTSWLWISLCLLTASSVLPSLTVTASATPSNRQDAMEFFDLTPQDISFATSHLEKIVTPLMLNITTAAQQFGLPHVTISNTQKDTCSPTIFTITDFSSPILARNLPVVLLSGEIHGDERIGPAAVMATVQLLSLAMACEIGSSTTVQQNLLKRFGRKYSGDAGINQIWTNSCAELDRTFPGLSREERIWLAYLGSRRHTVAIPTANCAGFATRKRGDGHVSIDSYTASAAGGNGSKPQVSPNTRSNIDPNRDFSYDRLDDNCFETPTARTLAAVAAAYPIQTVVTYHGGVVTLSYEWGSYSHAKISPELEKRSLRSSAPSEDEAVLVHRRRHPVLLSGVLPENLTDINAESRALSANPNTDIDRCPDYVAHDVVGRMAQRFAGSFPENYPVVTRNGGLGGASGPARHGGLYPLGTMTGTVYAVAGGMEDWFYASGWDPSLVRKKCSGRFASDRQTTLYTAKQASLHGLSLADALDGPRNRALVFLVETSNSKNPPQQEYGSRKNVLNPASSSGHVPRNLRLALAALDMVEPYVCLAQVSLSSGEVVPVSGAVKDSVQPQRGLQTDNESYDTSGSQNSDFEETVGSDRKLANSAPNVTVEWYVGGARTVEKTFLAIHESIHGDMEFKLRGARTDGQLEAILFHKPNSLPITADGPQRLSSIQSGVGRWGAPDAASPLLSADAIKPQQTFSDSFSAAQIVEYYRHRLSTDVSHPPLESYWIVAWAKVDPEMGNSQGASPALSPQSHVAQLRTNNTWRCDLASSGDFQNSDIDRNSVNNCVSSLFWPSAVMEVLVGPTQQVESRGGQPIWQEEFVSNSSNVQLQLAVAFQPVVTECQWWRRESLMEKTTIIDVPSPKRSRRKKIHRLLTNSTTTSEPTVDKKTPHAVDSDSHSTWLIFESAGPLLFGHSYISLVIGTVVAVYFYSAISSRIRRNRAHAAVTSNRYVSLPTGFHP